LIPPAGRRTLVRRPVSEPRPRTAATFYHAGPDKAILIYSADHYPAWRAELGLPDLSFGGFGENLTVAGLTEETVCVGDVLAERTSEG
jgi:MOSC domain-containing protein YiiM